MVDRKRSQICAGVAHDVGERLLRDAIGGDFDCRRKRLQGLGRRDRNAQAILALAAALIGVISYGEDEAELVKRGWA